MAGVAGVAEGEGEALTVVKQNNVVDVVVVCGGIYWCGMHVWLCCRSSVYAGCRRVYCMCISSETGPTIGGGHLFPLNFDKLLRTSHEVQFSKSVIQ